jgi:hypothetical protein
MSSNSSLVKKRNSCPTSCYAFVVFGFCHSVSALCQVPNPMFVKGSLHVVGMQFLNVDNQPQQMTHSQSLITHNEHPVNIPSIISRVAQPDVSRSMQGEGHRRKCSQSRKVSHCITANIWILLSRSPLDLHNTIPIPPAALTPYFA